VFIEILKAAKEIADFDVAFCGSREERDSLSAIASSLPFNVKLLAGELSLLGFAAFLSTCSALLAPDSGPRHIGNAAGIPVFFTRNLSQLAVETGKYCDSETDLVPEGYELVDSSDIAKIEKVIDVRRSAELIVRSFFG
jgi:ADP-heptose:LPS heptosyltransferase